MNQQLAIFAGAGELPYLAALTAQKRKLNFTVYHITEAELHPQLKLDQEFPLRTISLGNIAQTFAYLKEDKITQLVLLGKIEKQRILQDVKRDAAAEKIYNEAADHRDDNLFLEFAKGIAQMGIEILPQKELLPGCFLPAGVHTQKKAETPAMLADIEFGFEISRRIGSLDIGQTAVVFQKMVLAVEAIEGTDAAIERAGVIVRGQDARESAAGMMPSLSTTQQRGGVVCKRAKASQDPRFDLPAVGLKTLATMHNSGMQALVIDAAGTLVVNPEAFIRRADELGLIVIAL